MNVDQIFCSNQIVIPPLLPNILKKYAKAAIRTQPYDLLVWSAAYFKAMANGVTPPVKARLEFPLPENRQLTLGYIKLLVYQFGKDGFVSRNELTEKWNDVCLPPDTLYNILRLGSFSHSIDWAKFVAIALGFLEESLKGTMIQICEVFTEEPEGGSAMIPSPLFLDLYRYLGEMDCGIREVEEVVEEDMKEERKPCLSKEDDELESQDIDSIIRDIGEVDSCASIETRLEGPGAELKWPNIESGSETSAEIKVPSEPTDEGATSGYGLEVMEPIVDVVINPDFDEPNAAEEAEASLHQPSQLNDDQNEDMGEVTTDEDNEDGQIEEELPTKEELLVKEESMIKEEPLVKEESFVNEEAVVKEEELINHEVEEEYTEKEELFEQEEGEEDENLMAESGSDMESVKVVLTEKGEESELQLSSRDSLISENKKQIENIDDEIKIGKELSMVDLRPTMDRDTRRQIIEDGITGGEEARKRAEQAAAEEAERKRIEEEAKMKFHMYVPGIGPVLPAELMDKVEEYVKCCAERQEDMIMPRNLRHFLCPPLDLESPDRAKDLESLLAEAALLESQPEYPIEDSRIVEFLRPDSRMDSQSVMDSSILEDEPSKESQKLPKLNSRTSAGDDVETVPRSTSLTHLILGFKDQNYN